MFTITRRNLPVLALAAAAARPAVAAAPPIVLVLTPAAPGAPVMVGIDDGSFARHGVEIKPQLIPLMPTMPAILVSGSAQIGFMTTPTFLQAVDGGLDLVAVAGGGITSQSVPDASAIARNDVEVRKPSDFVGKTVGVPGLGAYYHVIFRWWLMSKAVDPAGVHFVETAFPQMLDALRGKAVDAVVCLDPFQSQILASGLGKVAVPIYKDVPNDKPIVIYVAARDWAEAHRQEVLGFRAGLAEAQKATAQDPEKAKQQFNALAKLPPAVLPHVSIGAQSDLLPVEGFAWWVEVLQEQKLLSTKPDVKKLIFT
jgi:NitT/TauT family transport system substrate-binding protein